MLYSRMDRNAVVSCRDFTLSRIMEISNDKIDTGARGTCIQRYVLMRILEVQSTKTDSPRRWSHSAQPKGEVL